MTDQLRESLCDLADTVEPVDLYDRAVRRSRRLARREATVGAGAALTALGLLAGGLWQLPTGESRQPSYALRPSPAATAAAPIPRVPPPDTRPAPAPTRHGPVPTSAVPWHKSRPIASPAATPPSRSLADLPGHVFYQRPGAETDVRRLSPADAAVEIVLPRAPSPVGISPDGKDIAYAVDGTLLVEHAGGLPKPLATGVRTAAQAPTWSPDGGRLLIETSIPMVLEVGSGTLTPIAAMFAGGRQFRWSGNGSALVYATSHCALRVSADGLATSVPVLGDTRHADNPDGLAACRPTSVDATGGRVTVPLQSTGETSAQAPGAADAVVNTVTGEVVPLPVSGSVVGALFDPAGNLLVRARHGRTATLSLFTPGGKLLVQATEPAELNGLDLLAYTR
jgi:TolB protein